MPAHHAAVVTGMMTASGTIRRGGQTAATFDPTTGVSTNAPPTVIYTGRLRLQDQLTKRLLQAEFGDQQVTISRVQLSLPVGSGAAPGDELTVDTCPDNPTLIGLLFRLLQVNDSTIAWQEEFICEAGSV